MIASSLGILILASFSMIPPGQGQDRPQDTFQADPAWKSLGKAVWFDPRTRTLVLRARVALREGSLEHLLCLTNSKEHESVLATDAPAVQIHAGLLLTGAEPGHPVKFRPTYQAPTGTPIQIDLEWVEDGKTRKADARQWVKDLARGKPLAVDWVFAGSEFYSHPETKERLYAASEGDLITVANFTSAILDVPIPSSDSDNERVYVANTANLPKQGTFVTMYLRPRKPAPAGDPAKKAATPK